jgi:thiamine-monophosphate kinase
MRARASKAQSAEDRLIARYFRPLATDPGAFALGDDAAALTPPAGADLVLTTDAVVGGVHFFPDDPADLVARKALRVNLSDLAAKGARPAGFLLTLALPKAIGEAWLKVFAGGLGADAEAYAYGCPLLGGDSVRTGGPITISITALGTLPRGTMVRRNGAQVGDRVVVTGTIGDAALGLMLRNGARTLRWKLGRAQREHLIGRYLVPQPRNALAEALRLYANAAMDVSDGLAGDLAKLCAASGVTAAIEVAQMPLSDAARKVVAAARVPLSAAASEVLRVEPALIETVLTGGDDYEIICTVTPDKLAQLRAAADKAGVAMTEIGNIVAGKGAPRFLDRSGKALLFQRPSFSHF